MKRIQLIKKLFLFLILILSFQSYGQKGQSLFSSATRAQLGLNSAQSIKLDSMIGNPIYLDHYYVSLSDLHLIQDSGSVKINLPDKNSVFTFTSTYIEYSDSLNYIYFGELNKCESGPMGYIHLISENGSLFGQINIEDEIYDLQDFGIRQNVLFKIDQSIYTEAECATMAMDTIQNLFKRETNEEVPAELRHHGCNVRVLFLFTQAADRVGNPENTAELFIAQTNQAARNSEAHVRFTNAGVVEFNGINERVLTPEQTRNFVQGNMVAQGLRNEFEADLVVLLTDGNWITPFGQVLGISFLNRWGDPDFGYVVVELDAGGGNFTCTHELAHDFGCKHDNDNRGAPDFVFDARGYDFRTGWWFFTRERLTIMRRLNGSNRIMHFSNPDVEFRNEPTGVDDERENEDQLSNLGCTIAQYRDFTVPFSIYITGPGKGDNSGTYTYCVNIFGCENPTSIVWERTNDGFNYIPFGSGNCITRQLPLDRDLRLRVTVTCADGEVRQDWFRTLNIDNWKPCGPPFFDGDQDNYTTVGIFPNPISEAFMLTINMQKPSYIVAELYDINGKMVKQLLNRRIQKENYQKSINLSGLHAGIYLLQVKMGEEIITKKIIKL